MQSANMEKQEIKKYMDELIRKLNQWNIEYYVYDNPSVPDAVYDKAMKELEGLEAEYPEFKQPDSPTQRVGGGFADKLEKISHLSKMLSLQNAFDVADLQKFADNLAKVDQHLTFVTEPKIDGLSISLVYKNGQLVAAVTRGDGTVGENVIHNVLTIPGIPKKIPYTGTCEIRGEVYMNRMEFEELNRKLETKFANPRNAAAGTLRNLDPEVARERKLHALFYFIPQWQEMGLTTHWAVLNWLKQNGFPIADEIHLQPDFAHVLKTIEWWGGHRKEMPYQIDGVVIKVNENEMYDTIGHTAKFPKWAIAYKFPAVVGETKVKDIICEVGRTGKITYVGVLEPIKLDGSTINRVTLNNAEYIQTKHLNINDTIYIYKSGDVIPYFDQVASRGADEKPFIPATVCPSCSTKLVQDGVEQFCENENCEERKICQLIYFCTKECLDIKGLSEKTVRKFYHLGFLRTIADLFRLKEHAAEIYQLDLKIKEKMLSKILVEIEAAKQKPLANWLNGLSIHHIGKGTSQKIAKVFPTIDAVMDASISDLSLVEDVGEISAAELHEFFAKAENKALIQTLKDLGVLFTTPQKTVHHLQSPYNGKTFVITGTFSIPRNQLMQLLEERYQIKFVGKVSKKTDYLLSGVEPGSKFGDAKALNIPIIQEEFWNNESQNR